MSSRILLAFAAAAHSVGVAQGFGGESPRDAPAPDRPHVVFVTGDDEYRSEISMPMVARILEERHGLRCTVLYAVDPSSSERNPRYKRNIPGLEALETADLAVIFLRFRELPQEQFDRLLDFARSKKPLVGFRTSTHAFLYPAGNPLSEWNDRFGTEFFGQKWITHHGHSSSTAAAVIPERREHPVLRGVAGEFRCRSWLYHVDPLAGECMPLISGTAIESEKNADQQRRFPLKQPVAWTKTDGGRRTFFTTLGHPADFEQAAFRRLVINGALWCLEREAPQEGANAEPVEAYVTPPTR